MLNRQNEGWVPNITGKATPEVAYAIQRLYTELNNLKGVVLRPMQNVVPFKPFTQADLNTLRSALQADGKAPLKVTGLAGQLSEPQKGRAQHVDSIPQFNDPLSQDGTLIVYNDVVYRYDTTTNPGVWKPIQGIGVMLVDTHANRLLISAADYAIGTAFVESDRRVLYRGNGTNWIYVCGEMTNTFASRPADLGANDAGFLFLATDTLVQYYWTGAAWVQITDAPGSGVTSVNGATGAVVITIADTHANRGTYLPGSYPVGALYMETDYLTLYRNTGAAWVYVAGQYSNTLANIPVSLGVNDTGFLFFVTDKNYMYRWTGAAWTIQPDLGVVLADTHANRSSYAPGSYPTNSLYYETDRQATYRNSGSAWLLLIAFRADTTANKPGDLGANDYGFLYYDTTTSQLQYWNGASWATIGGSGTVTSVAMTVPSFLSVSGSPITTSGTLAVSLATQTANTVFAGPSSGGAATPTFRALIPADYADPAWTSWTPTITLSAGTPTTTTLEAAYVQNGKSVKFRIAWTGTISSANQDIQFSLPVTPVSQTLYQTCATWYNQSGFIIPSAGLILDSTASAYIRSTANFPSATTLLTLLEGTYEAA